jgi:LacI family transcriptional regulator, galactose operon repressor
MNRRPHPTLRDVAALAGLSVTTVSHVLNDVPHKRIAVVTRERVRAAAVELAYRPNHMARGLRLRRSNTIGFVSDQVGTSPFAGMMILGAQQAAGEVGSLLMLMNSHSEPDLEAREIRSLLDHQVDGIVYAAHHHRVVTVPAALDGVATVLCDASADRPQIPSVVPDEYGGARAAVGELVAHGHRRIGYLTNGKDIPAVPARLAGFKRALKDGGGGFDPSLVVIAPASEVANGYVSASVLLDLAHPPTALFCFNDRMAMGAYQAAAARGLDIPGDLSIVGFDNQQVIASGLRPGLTTVQLPHYEMGQWAVRMLSRLIESSDEEQAEHATLQCPLVRRGSVGPAPG